MPTFSQALIFCLTIAPIWRGIETILSGAEQIPPAPSPHR
jgi:hypothetical protein